MKKILGPLAVSITLFACNNSTPPTEAQEEAKDTAKKEEPVIVPDHGVVTDQSDSTIHFVKATGTDSLVGKGHLDKKGDPVICYIDLEKGNKISGRVIPDKAGANIRFSHIYMPDNSSDGPFGQTIEYTAKKSGTYRLYISPNRMAGDPESTGFTVVVRVR